MKKNSKVWKKKNTSLQVHYKNLNAKRKIKKNKQISKKKEQTKNHIKKFL